MAGVTGFTIFAGKLLAMGNHGFSHSAIRGLRRNRLVPGLEVCRAFREFDAGVRRIIGRADLAL